MIYRHGDVILKGVEKVGRAVPFDECKNFVLAEGEVTGHMHTLKAGEGGVCLLYTSFEPAATCTKTIAGFAPGFQIVLCSAGSFWVVMVFSPARLLHCNPVSGVCPETARCCLVALYGGNSSFRLSGESCLL